MNGIQRFFLCALSLFLIMLCYPHYAHGAGWAFVGITMAITAGLLLLTSVIVGLMGLDRYDLFNRLLTLVIWIGFTYYILLNFPQQDKISPLQKIKHKQFPTRSDLLLGARHFTFAFDLMPEAQKNGEAVEPFRNHANMPYLNDESKQSQNAVAKPKPKPEEEAKIEIFMENEAGYVDAPFMPTDE